MNEPELKTLLSRVQSFSVGELLTLQGELLTLQEALTKELWTKTATEPNQNGAKKIKVVTHFEADKKLSPELQKELQDMALFTDKALWKTAKTAQPIKSQKKLRELNHKQQKEGEDSLTQAEKALQHDLVKEYQRYMLLRAHAAVLLKERGHDISSLGPKR